MGRMLLLAAIGRNAPEIAEPDPMKVHLPLDV